MRWQRLTLFFAVFAFLAFMANDANASIPSNFISLSNWWRACASVDMDFYHDRYYINHNTTCDGTSGTSYVAGSGNTGVQNFITGTGATFTRSGTANYTDVNDPFYTNANQSFVSRASVTNNVTSTFAPFYTNASQAFVSRASSATYFDNTGTLQTATTNTARSATYSYNGSSWVANSGTLIEAAATNSIRNNTMSGAAAGTPGTDPTNWSSSPTTYNGLTINISGTGTQYGLSYIELTVTGTPTATSNWILLMETASQIAASVGQTWTQSEYLWLPSGSATGILGMSNAAFLYTSGGTLITSITGSGFLTSSLGTTPTRNQTSYQVANSGTAYIRPSFTFAYANGVAVNMVIRIGVPQMELGANATSVIATSSAAVTRSADIYNQQPASYFDSTGTLNFTAANTARSSTYNYSGGSWVANSGTLIEPAATNSIRNNMMVGAVATDGVERTNNGTFSTTTPNVCSGSVTSGANTLSCSNSYSAGWVGTINSGSGSISAASGDMTLTGDGTNAASVYEVITTVSGYLYTVSVTTGSGNPVTVQVGGGVGTSGLLAVTTEAASTTVTYEFQASSATSYVQINNISGTAANVTAVSVQSMGKLPTNWLSTLGSNGLIQKVIGTGTENGINYVDINVAGTATSTSTGYIASEATNAIAGYVGALYTSSYYLKLAAGSIASLSSLKMQMIADNSSGTYLGDVGAQLSVAGITSSSLSQQRFVQTGSATYTTMAYMDSDIVMAYTSGAVINFTLRIGMPQVEVTGFATSVMPTFGSVVTRTADVYSGPTGGTYYNSSGVITQAGANVPRLDFGPGGGSYPLGILMEESRTNLMNYSSAPYGMNGGADYNGYQVSNVTAPDNMSNFVKCYESNGATGGQTCRWVAAAASFATLATSTTYTVSMYVKAAELSTFTFLVAEASNGVSSATVNLTAGTSVVCSTATGGTTTSIQSLGNGVYRVSLTFATGTSATTNDYFDMRLATTTSPSCTGQSFTGDGSSGVYFWGVQLEAAGFATSYIPTSGAAATRNADIFTLPVTAGGGSGWYTQSVGTLGASGQVEAIRSFPSPATIDDGTTNNAVSLYYQSGATACANVVNGNSQSWSSCPSSYTANTLVKGVMAYNATSVNDAYGATLGTVGSSITIPSSLTELVVGGGRNTSALYYDGWVNRIWYMPTRQPDASLPDYSR